MISQGGGDLNMWCCPEKMATMALFRSVTVARSDRQIQALLFDGLFNPLPRAVALALKS